MLRALPAAALLAAPTLAQGLVPPVGEWVVGRVGGDFGGACAAPPRVQAELATLVVQDGGGYLWSAARREVCGDGSAQDVQTAEAGAWALDELGILALTPLASTTPERSLLLAFDHAHAQWESGADQVPSLAVGVPTSTGNGLASLVGTYWVGRMRYTQGAGGLTAESVLGEMAFDGAGGFLEIGTRHTVTAAQSTTVTFADAGTYAVQPDGRVHVGADEGALRADGELVFWLERGESWVGLTVCVRKGGLHDTAALDGAWDLGVHWLVHGQAPTFTELTTTLDIDASTGKFTVVGPGLSWTPSGPNTFTWSNGDTWVTQPDGQVQLLFGGFPITNQGRVSASDDLVLLVDALLPGFADVELGSRRCRGPVPYGAGTAGVAGTPHLTGATVDAGAPLALDLAGVADGAVVGLGYASRPAASVAGIPFAGGAIWLDPATVLAVQTHVAGPSGLSVLAPTPPGAVGAHVYAQAAVVDATAPGGLALSNGLAVRVCAP